MKTLFAAVVFSVITSFNAFAQASLGIKGGLNLTNIAMSNFPSGDVEMRPAFHIGGFSNYAFTDNFSGQAELLYSNKGFHTKSSGAIMAADIRFHYLTLPLLASYRLFGGLDVEAGPELGLLLAATSRTENEVNNISKIWENKFDLGLNGGLRYHLGEALQIGVRYNHGLSNVLGDVQFTDVNGQPMDVKARNRVIQFSIGYTILRP